MNLEQTAIERLKLGAEMSQAYYNAPLMVTYSGGKDSDVLLALALQAGIPIEVVHSHTTADAPQTVHHVRHVFRELEQKGVPCSIQYPVHKGMRTSLWALIPLKGMPPTRKARYCCEVLKETTGKNRAIATGVRWTESTARRDRDEFDGIGRSRAETVHYHRSPGTEQTALGDVLILGNDNDDRRRLIEHCTKKGKMVCNPIIDWTDRDIWEYISIEKISTNPLYQKGFDRVGCVGCALAGIKKRYHDFEIFPAYKKMWMSAFEKMIEVRKAKKQNVNGWDTALDVFTWWMMEDSQQLNWEDVTDATINV